MYPSVTSQLTVQIAHGRGAEAADAHVVVAGELDAGSAHTLHVVLEGALDEGAARIEIDLADVEFIDSTGLRVLAWLLREGEGRGVAVEICGVSRAAERILEVTGLIDELRARSGRPS